LEVECLQVYFNYLVQVRSLSPARCRVYLHGIVFVYLHILPKGFMRTRHFGYLSNRTRRRKLAVIRHCLSRPPKPADQKDLGVFAGERWKNGYLGANLKGVITRNRLMKDRLRPKPAVIVSRPELDIPFRLRLQITSPSSIVR
jgi:hypothetical protein